MLFRFCINYQDMRKEMIMAKILVIYHSQQYGNTGILAEALAQGARGEGAEVTLINTNEHRVTLDEFLAADAVALGSPDYFSYVAGTIKTLFDDIYQWDKAGEMVKGKQAALFFSHGSGGRVRGPLEQLAERFFEQVGEPVGSPRPITDDAKNQCAALGRELAQRIR
jgi:multimeric flavodoxin WrbA